MPLLAQLISIRYQDRVDDAGKLVRLGPAHRVSARVAAAIHLSHAPRFVGAEPHLVRDTVKASAARIGDSIDQDLHAVAE